MRVPLYTFVNINNNNNKVKLNYDAYNSLENGQCTLYIDTPNVMNQLIQN